jgi:hypothetical protein
MTASVPVDASAARAEAARLAPAVTLNEDDPWIAFRIDANIAAWHQLSSGNSKLPKLLLRDDIVLHGSTSTTERFLEIIKETFTRSPEAAIPVSIGPR